MESSAIARFIPDALPGVSAAAWGTGHIHALTYICSVQYEQPGVGLYYRTIGITSEASVAELSHAILQSYQWPDELWPDYTDQWELRVMNLSDEECALPTGVELSPVGVQCFSRQNNSVGTALSEAIHLGSAAELILDNADYETLGVSARFRIQVVSALSREESTPEVVCITGTFFPLLPEHISPSSDEAFVPVSPQHPLGVPTIPDIAEINRQLVGEETVEYILSSLNSELQELLVRSEFYEFIPVLQALDLDRPAEVSDRSAELLADAPVEDTLIGRIAAWGRIIALSTLSDSEIVEEITQAFFRAVVPIFVPDFCSDAELLAMTAEDITALCPHTNRILALAGADGWRREGDHNPSTPLVPKRSVVERLEMYRFLLQR